MPAAGWAERNRLFHSGLRQPLAPTPVPGPLESLLAQLKTAEELGVDYVRDALTDDFASALPLTVHTHLANPAHCGRGRRGWSVRGGVANAYTWAVLRDRPVLGNRSLLAQLSFCSTQTGVAPGEHGLVEMRLSRGTMPDDVPARVRMENGTFYLLALNDDTVLAGDRSARVFRMSGGTVYTLTVLLFRKAVYARLQGADVPDGAVELEVPDCRRFIPGLPGFGLWPNARATGGELAVFDWRVTPVGPAENCRLGAIGDSITAGNADEPEAESYVHLATRVLGQDLVLNTGSGGANTTQDKERFPFEIAPFRPGIVWIEGGTNDIGAGVKAEAIFANMMAEANAINWGGKAVLSTVPPRVMPPTANHTELDRLNRMIRESGRPFVDRHAAVCDPADPRQIRPEFSKPDGVHVTATGHVRIAEMATQVFRTL